MICTQLYAGQGLGNQLWLYVVTRVLAQDSGYRFGIKDAHEFKGVGFLNLDFGERVIGGHGPAGGPPYELPESIANYYREECEAKTVDGFNTYGFNPNLFSISDDTLIDGNLQNEKYIAHRKSEISDWLSVQPSEHYESLIDDETCVINFRGGEYTSIPSVFLPPSYWTNARNAMRKVNPNMKFRVVTDDPKAARLFFPNDEILNLPIHGDYYLINKAKYLILSNSSFAWFPAWTNVRVLKCIAPKYWWAFNSNNNWLNEGNITKGWDYLDLHDVMQTCKSVESELKVHEIDFRNSVRPRITSPVDRAYRLYFAIKRITLRLKAVCLGKLQYEFKRIDRFGFGILVQKFKIKIKVLTFKTAWGTNEMPLMRSILPVRSTVNPILKNNRIFDCFFFFNELDVLEIRLESLFQFVDYFVLVESRISFTGEEREPLYEKHKERFSKFHKQIIHIVIDEVPRTREEAEGIIYDRFENVHEKVVASRLLKSHSVPKTPGLSQWVIEYFIKESLIRISDSVEDNDLIFISDVDEIWNSRARFPMPRNKVLVFKQKAHVYFLNNVSNESWRNWTGTIAINGRMFHQGSPSEMRVRGRFPRQVVVNGGWHLTLQGGLEVVEEKLESWDENELAADRRAKVEFFINSLVDLRGRNISYRLDNKNLPEGVLRNPNRYQKLIKR